MKKGAGLIIIMFIPFVITGCNKNYDEKIMIIENRLETIDGQLSSVESKTYDLEQRQDVLEKSLNDIIMKKRKEIAASQPSGMAIKAMSIKDIQNALKNANFYKGPVDNKTGTELTQAIKEFQKANGLKDDGIAGPKTKAALMQYLQEEAY